jgi:ABC-type sugar transport system permease subunit
VAARDRIFGWVYVSPLLLVLVPFFVAPLLVVITASFFESDGYGGLIADPTLQNYVDIFSRDADIQPVRRDHHVHGADLAVLHDHRVLGSVFLSFTFATRCSR